jgi:restriction endonuclease S subunit
MYLNSKYGQKGFLKYRHDVDQPNINLAEIQRIKLIVPPKGTQEQVINRIEPIEAVAIDLELKAEGFLKKADNILLSELRIDLPSEGVSYFFKEGKECCSNYYYSFKEQNDDRLHYLFNHPKLEILDKFKNKYQTVLMEDVCREPTKRGEQPKYSDFGVMVIKTVDLKNHFIDYENTLRVSEEFYESKPQAHIQKKDILVSSTGYVSVGKIDVFDFEEPAFADGHISIVRPNEDYDPYFVTYFLRSPLGQLQFEKWFTGSSGQIEVQPKDLNKFILPSKEDISRDRQKEIANKITEEYKKAWNYEQQARSKRQEAKELFEKLMVEG